MLEVLNERVFFQSGGDFASQFEKYESDTFGLPYDYESIMHYGHNYFSRSAHLPTIIPRVRPNSRQRALRMGNREKMTDIDAQKISYLYKCMHITYERNPSAVAVTPRHVTRRRNPTQSHTATARPTTRAPAASAPPVVHLSEDDLYRLRKNKYNESRNAWQRFKNAVKQVRVFCPIKQSTDH